MQIFGDLFAYIKYFYYLCSDKRLFRSLINNNSINQINVTIMANGGSRGLGSSGRKPTSTTTKRGNYGGGGKISNK